MEPDSNQIGATNQRKQAIARLISGLMKNGAGKELDESAIIAAHPDLMPELQIALRRVRRTLAEETALIVAATAIPPAGGSAAGAPEQPAVQVSGYSIERELGRGGQAVVYLAVQQNTGRKVAIKIMQPEALAGERAVARFKREVQVLAALDHPNIVGILDTGVTPDGGHFIVMNYVAGETLDEYMKSRRWGDSSDPTKLLRLFLKICAAVNVAHIRGIVHRDLKPVNIRIDERGEPHILDFGLAHTPLDRLAGGEHPIAVTGEFLGSLPWCSPEQAEGDPDRIDMRTDVYSLGVILYQILTDGKFPYEVVGNMRDVLNNILNAEPTPPSKVVAAGGSKHSSQDRRPGKLGAPPINETIERIVLKALAKNRELRYQSAGELGRDVAQYLAGRQTAVRQPQPPAAASPGKARVSRHAVLVLAAVVLCAAGIGAWMLLRKSASHAVASAPSIPAAQVAPAATPAADNKPPELPVTIGPRSNRGFGIVGGTCHLEGDALALTPGVKGQCVIYLGPFNWSNYDLSFGAMTNGQGASEGFRIIIHAFEHNACQIRLGDFDNAAIELLARYNGVAQRLQLKSYRIEPDRWCQVRVKVRGPEIQCFLNGQECLDATDNRFTHGRPGLATFSSAVRFRDFKVTAPNGLIIWQGPPDLSELPAGSIDPPHPAVPPDLHKTDLLKQFDPAADALAGVWSATSDGVTGQGAGAQIQFRTAPPAEYDYRVSFVRSQGNGPIAMIAAQQGHPFAWIVGGHDGTVTGFGLVNGKAYDQNETMRRADQWISNGLVHTLVLRVRKDLIMGYVDGAHQDGVDGKSNVLTLPPEFRQDNSARLGIWLGGDEVVIKSADVFELAPRLAPATGPSDR